MRDWVLKELIDPATGHALHIRGGVRTNEQIESGVLVSETGEFEVRRGIPRFNNADAASETSDSFSFKWSQRDGLEPPSFLRWYTGWLLEKYGFGDMTEAHRYFSSREMVLEVGCGSGLSAILSRAGVGGGTRWVGLDLTDAIDIAHARFGDHPDAAFVQADLMAAPFRPGTFDTVFTEGVLHHTPSTFEALRAASKLLRPGGHILFYVYARKAPVREWTDDYLRSLVSILPPAQAWDAMHSITNLAHALADLHVTVDIPEDVPLLDIKAGRQDIQRLIYWHFAKLFWNDDMGFEGSQTVNFDWYHPPYAHRQTLPEIMDWCTRLDLAVTYSNAQESGYTIRATKL